MPPSCASIVDQNVWWAEVFDDEPVEFADLSWSSESLPAGTFLLSLSNHSFRSIATLPRLDRPPSVYNAFTTQCLHIISSAPDTRLRRMKHITGTIQSCVLGTGRTHIIIVRQIRLIPDEYTRVYVKVRFVQLPHQAPRAFFIAVPVQCY